jgi:hypothetical protein
MLAEAFDFDKEITENDLHIKFDIGPVKELLVPKSVRKDKVHKI